MTATNIPIIYLDDKDAASRLLHAAATYGFVYVQHENIIPSREDVDGIFTLAKKFFDLPNHIKAECTVHQNKGFVGMHAEALDPGKHRRGDCKEAFNLGEFDGKKAQQPLPKVLVDAEEQLAEFQAGCHALCCRILELFATALEIEESAGGRGWFSTRHDRSQGPSGTVLRLLHYPPVPQDEDLQEDIRAGAHSDYGSVTLLFRLPDQPGLELLTPEGTWATVPVNPEGSGELPILVNIGDLLSFWTNGLLKSTVHRVVFPASNGASAAQDRYSIAYFCHPLDSAELVKIPSTIVQARAGSTSHPITALDHLTSRLAATYGLK